MSKGKCPVALGVLVLLLMACNGEQKRTAYTPADNHAVDSMMADIAVGPSADESMPMAADELFDDFFFNYATNKRLQQERTTFPLPVNNGSEHSRIERKQWKMEHFFMNQDYYILLFDSPEQMELVKDTSVSHVVVEHIMFQDNSVCQYRFNRQKGTWMLSEIEHQPLAHNANAQFFGFYQHFVTDSVFQRESLSQQIDFTGTDPENDFETIEGVITPDFWSAFAPEFPSDDIYNIVYGMQNPAAMQKVFVIRGIANGLEVEVTFALQKGRWKLTRLTT